MSLKHAMKFIQGVQEDPVLRAGITALDFDADLEEIVTIGREAGFLFTVEELRKAFTLDWALRRSYFSSRPSP